MASKRAFMIWFFGGLAIFAVSIFLHAPLTVEGVPGGILDHQSAPDAATVDAIHAAWQAAGVYGQAKLAMVSDLIFIGVFGIGCVLGGQYYRRAAASSLRVLGWVALFSGIAFLITDYGETIAQIMQLQANAGRDGLASFASSLGPVKSLSWLGGFVSLIAALILERFKRGSE